MIVALFPNASKHRSIEIAKDISHFFTSRGVEVVAEDSIANSIEACPLSQIDQAKIDFLISLGGDGTILRVTHRHPTLEAPLLGINLGSLGFMADVPLHDIYPSLEDFLAGRYVVQERLIMEGTVNTSSCFAVNEIVVHRAVNPSLVELGIYVDGIYLNTFSADGIILSTPSGSTAYSLAAGGPILTPELNAFVLTPISPHTISNRPIVLMPKCHIQIKYLSPLQPVEISYDGISSFTMGTNETFTIIPSLKKFRLVSLNRHDYFSTLREKLGWAGKLKI